MRFKEHLRCIVCGDPLVEHGTTGRPRRFCSDACRAKESRALRGWAHLAVDAFVAGEPEPSKNWRA